MKTSGIKWILSLLVGLMLASGLGVVQPQKAKARITKKVHSDSPRRLVNPGIGPFFSWFAVQKRMQK